MIENAIILHDLAGRPVTVHVDQMEYRRDVNPDLGDNPAGHTVILLVSGTVEVKETEAQIAELIKALP
jgi:hypothetical protein